MFSIVNLSSQYQLFMRYQAVRVEFFVIVINKPNHGYMQYIQLLENEKTQYLIDYVYLMLYVALKAQVRATVLNNKR